MIKRRICHLIPIVIAFLLIPGCVGQSGGENPPKNSPTTTSTTTATLQPTQTNTRIPTNTPTEMATATPTEIMPPQPASLIGTVTISDGDLKPFISVVEIREADSFVLIGKAETDPQGAYRIVNIDPGTYEIWVRITEKPGMVPGCGDVALPGKAWRMGIKFGEDRAMTMENKGLSVAFMVVENINSATLQATGFYAVLGGFRIRSGLENQLDVTLICR